MRDRIDAAAVLFECADGTIWTHVTQALDNNFEVTTLLASFYGLKSTAHLRYGGKVFVRGGDQHYVGQMGSVYNGTSRISDASFGLHPLSAKGRSDFFCPEDVVT